MLLFSFNELYAQKRPQDFIIDWNHAGCETETRIGLPVIRISKYKAGSDISADINGAVRNLEGHAGIVYIPPGTYYLKFQIELSDSIILRGAGSDATHLIISLGNSNLAGLSITTRQNNTCVPLKAYLEKGTDAIPAILLPEAQPGDYIQIRENNGPWDTKPIQWAKKVKGQILKVSHVSRDSVYFDEPLRISFDPGMEAEIRVATMTKGIGIEALKLSREEDDDKGRGFNIFLSYAANCWIKGVESDHSEGSHILATDCSHLQITGCYFHNACHYDGISTGGYGVTLINHTGDCLVQDNIFKTLRHAMVVKQGANGNVFGYNYSFDTKRTEIPSNAASDIALHGHYAFANLFEGNIVQTIQIDQAWGPSGPYNTFFRNLTELYGIIVTAGNVNSDKQCFVANQLTGSGYFLGGFSINGEGHFMYGNYEAGNIIPAASAKVSEASYYLASLPSFWNINYNWPCIGYPNEPGSGTNPARERVKQGGTLTVFNEALNMNTFPNPFENSLTVELENMQQQCALLYIFDMQGKVLFHETLRGHEDGTAREILDLPLSSGMYLMRIECGSQSAFRRIIKN